MKKIIAVRHGETFANLDKRYLGSTDSPLTEEGKKQMLFFKKYIIEEDIEVVYSSPLGRAVESAEILCDSFVVDSRLAEMDFGIFEGMTYDEIMKRYPDEGDKFYSDIENFKIPSGESFIDVKMRVQDFLDSMKEESALLLTHGGWIRGLLALIMNGEKEIWDYTVGNGMGIEVLIDEGKFILGRVF